MAFTEKQQKKPITCIQPALIITKHRKTAERGNHFASVSREAKEGANVSASLLFAASHRQISQHSLKCKNKCFFIVPKKADA